MGNIPSFLKGKDNDHSKEKKNSSSEGHEDLESAAPSKFLFISGLTFYL